MLLLRGGYVLIQFGSIPTENVYFILLHNVVDISVSVAAFGLVGFSIAFGQDKLNGTIGYGEWIGSEEADYDSFIMGKMSLYNTFEN